MLSINTSVQALSPDLLEKYRGISPAAMGHHIENGIMNASIRPIQQNISVVGRAVTVQCLGRDSAVVYKVIDLLQKGDILVIDRAGDMRYACWGEMTTLASHLRGVAGVIIDGLVTDVGFIRNCPMPVYCKGVTPITTQLTGTQGSINQPIQCGGVVVKAGDLICADDNGVAVLDPALAAAWHARFQSEEEDDANYRDKLQAGKLISEISAIDELIGAAGKAVII